MAFQNELNNSDLRVDWYLVPFLEVITAVKTSKWREKTIKELGQETRASNNFSTLSTLKTFQLNFIFDLFSPFLYPKLFSTIQFCFILFWEIRLLRGNSVTLPANYGLIHGANFYFHASGRVTQEVDEIHGELFSFQISFEKKKRGSIVRLRISSPNSTSLFAAFNCR